MTTSGRKPADLYFLTPLFALPFLSILPYPAGQKYSGLLGAQKRGTPKPFGQSVPLFIWSELIQNVVVADVKQQDQRLAVVFPDHPDVHVHTELEQIGCSSQKSIYLYYRSPAHGSIFGFSAAFSARCPPGHSFPSGRAFPVQPAPLRRRPAGWHCRAGRTVRSHWAAPRSR